MLKKVVIAGLAVAVGVAVLAFVLPHVFDSAMQKARDIRQNIDDSVPLDSRIDVLKGKLRALEQSQPKLFDAVAKESVAVDKLAKEVNTMSDNLALEWKRIEIMREDLDTQKASFNYGGKDFKRSEVEKQLATNFASYKVAEEALDAKKGLLNARQEALDAAKEQLKSFEGRRDEMAARVSKMEADLKLVQMREQATALKVDDNDYASLNAEIDEVSNKISERQKALDLKAEFTHGPIDPLAEKPATKGDILKQIDDYKAARNGAPKTNIAEQK